MKIEAVAHFACRTGENPRVCPLDGAVFWTDIPAGTIYRRASGGPSERVYCGPVVGGFEWDAREKGWVLLRERDIVRWNGAGTTPLAEFHDADALRFNDAIFDSRGRLWAGGIGAHSGGAGLYRIEPDGHIARVCGATQVSNGIAFSPDESQLFWTDSSARQLRVAEFDLCGGTLHDERLLCQLALADGVGAGMPDGLMWWNGVLLSGRNKGWGVAVHHAQSGEVCDFWEFPVAKITALCSDSGGGFWVTSGGGDGINTVTLDGALFHVTV